MRWSPRACCSRAASPTIRVALLPRALAGAPLAEVPPAPAWTRTTPPLPLLPAALDTLAQEPRLARSQRSAEVA